MIGLPAPAYSASCSSACDRRPSSGPDDSALFYSFYLYRKAFEQFQIGYASALTWILFVIILALTLIVFRSSSFWVYYEGQKERAT